MLLPPSRFSRVQLCATLQMAAHQAPPSLGFSRQEHWSGLPFPSPMNESESEVAQSCLTPRDPMDCSLPGPSVHGIFQARVLEWGATAFSGRLCDCIQCNNKDFIRGRERIRIREGNRAKEARQREGEVMMVARGQSEMWKWKQGLSDAIATPGTERGAPTRECGRPRKAGQGKEADSSLQLPE